MTRPYDFAQPSFAVTPLDQAPAAEIGKLALKLSDGRVFLLTGAGLSAGPPTSLPVGPQAAALLRDEMTAFGLVLTGVGNPDDLGDIAAAVEAELGDSELRNRLKRIVDWEGRPPNLAHVVVALLFAERLISYGFTANWDPCVAKAAHGVEGLQLDCPCDLETLRTSNPPMFVHIHGKAGHPETLVATSADLAKSPAADWTEPQLAGATAQSDPLVVGFAAEPKYMLDTIEIVLNAVGRKPAGVISLDPASAFVAGSPRLAGILQVDVDCDHYVPGDASDRLAEILRAWARVQVGDVLGQAQQRADNLASPRLPLDLDKANLVRERVMQQSLRWLLELLWRGARLPSDQQVLQPPLGSRTGELAGSLAAVMLLASCPDVADVDATPSGFRLTLEGGEVIDLWLAIPPEPIAVQSAARAAFDNSPRFSSPGEEDIPLVMIHARLDGYLPTGHVSLTHGGGPSASLVDGRRRTIDALDLSELDRRATELAGGAAARALALVSVA